MLLFSLMRCVCTFLHLALRAAGGRLQASRRRAGRRSARSHSPTSSDRHSDSDTSSSHSDRESDGPSDSSDRDGKVTGGSGESESESEGSLKSESKCESDVITTEGQSESDSEGTGRATAARPVRPQMTRHRAAAKAAAGQAPAAGPPSGAQTATAKPATARADKYAGRSGAAARLQNDSRYDGQQSTSQSRFGKVLARIAAGNAALGQAVGVAAAEAGSVAAPAAPGQASKAAAGKGATAEQPAAQPATPAAETAVAAGQPAVAAAAQPGKVADQGLADFGPVFEHEGVRVPVPEPWPSCMLTTPQAMAPQLSAIIQDVIGPNPSLNRMPGQTSGYLQDGRRMGLAHEGKRILLVIKATVMSLKTQDPEKYKMVGGRSTHKTDT